MLRIPVDINKPNRDLDALVAEHVLGFTRTTVGPDAKGQHGDDEVLVPPGFSSPPFEWPRVGRVAFTYLVPEFSRNITEAWAIVEKLGRRGFNIQLNGIHGEENYRARFFPVGEVKFCDNSLDGACYEFGRTAPLAICFAALRWKKNGGTNIKPM